MSVAAVLVGSGLTGQVKPPADPPPKASAAAEMQLPPPPSIRLLELQGTPKERGLAHGKALKKEIHELLALFKKDLTARYGLPADEFVTLFRQQTDFESACLKWTPKLIQELHGIAEGAEVDYDTLFVFQLIDEIWAQGETVLDKGEKDRVPPPKNARVGVPPLPSAAPRGGPQSGKLPGDKCTSLGVDRTGGAPTLVAQNLDIPQFFHGYQTLLHLKEGKGKTRMQSFVVTVPGLLGMNGMNNVGIGVAVNTMLQLQPCPDGLPVAFVVRGLLERRNFHDARKFLYTIRHASGQNYILGGRDVAHSFECSARRVVRYISSTPGPRVWHTNHPLASEDWAPKFRAQAKAAGVEPKAHLRTCPRFEALNTRFGATPAPSAGDLIEALKDRLGQQDGISNRMTFASTVMQVGSNDLLRITVGAPDRNAFATYRFPEERKIRKSEK